MIGRRCIGRAAVAALLATLTLLCPRSSAQDGTKADSDKKRESLPQPRATFGAIASPQVAPPSQLNPNVKPIDLCTALKLAGVYNPEILLAAERITAADAQRLYAASQILPNINFGTNYDHHQGNLQQSSGRIIQTNRDALYLGLGANAVAAGTVGVPGLLWKGNVSEAIYATLVARTVVRQRDFESEAVRNAVMLKVTSAYLDLLRATGLRAIAAQTRADAAEMARVTANFAKTGQGKQADADRAAAELALVNEQLVQADGAIEIASARLAQLLNLDPSVRLHPADGWAVPTAIVPDPIPLRELIAIALTQRPELKARQAAVRAAFLELQGAKVLPFSPNFLIGYSNGTFGGGSNLIATTGQPRFGNFDERQDFDAVLYWTVQNLGVGNLALVKLARSNLRQDELRALIVLNDVRAQVATAQARSHARYAQIATGEQAVTSSRKAFQEDLFRTRNGQGLPIELLDSLRLLGRSRQAYLDAIIDYNRAQFDLYVALGQPPACFLSRPVPEDLVPPAIPPSSESAPTPPAVPQGKKQ